MSLPKVQIRRHMEEVAVQSLADFRVVILNGPRQSGKSTLLRKLHGRIGGTLLSLDDPPVLDAARADPTGFVAGFGEPLLLDEVQRAGNPLLLAIKATVDRDPRPGRFVLTGSTRFLTVPSISESLAGRAEILDLWPFSTGEILSRKERFLDRLLGGPDHLRSLEAEPLERERYIEMISAGGFPEVVARAPGRPRSAWFSAYLRTLIHRDVTEVSRIHHIDELTRLVELTGGLTAQELNVSALASRAEMDRQTAQNYLGLLETTFLIHRLPSWSRNVTAKVKRRRKLYLTDSGIAAHLVGVDPQALASPAATQLGPLLETFVVSELAKSRTWSAEDVTLRHYRDRGGPEVDVVVETRDQRVAGIEIKAASGVRREDFRWLELLRDRVGAGFVQGVVLYLGERTLPFGDRLTALPVSALWTP